MNWLPGTKRGTAGASTRAAAERAATEHAKASRARAVELRALLARVAGAERAAHERELGRALAEGGGAPLDTDTETVIAAAACHCGDKHLARQWLERLHDEARLADVASEARYAELRFAAAQRLSDAALIERVAARTREHDKRVHRHCTELLRGRKASAGRAERAAQLAASLAALGEEPPPLAAARLAPLEREAQALGNCAEAAPCRAGLERLYARQRTEGETLRELHRAAERGAVLAAGIAAAPWPVAERIDAWQGECGALQAIADGLPGWAQGAATGRTLRAALDAARARIAELAEDIERHAACERFLDAGDDAADPAAWEALVKPRHAAACAALEARWASRAGQVRAKLAAARAAAQPKAPPAPDLAGVQKALFAFEQALAQGHVGDAERADAKVERLLGTAHAPRGIDARWKRARGELARLRGWARWGTTQAHDQLIAEAEKTLAEPMGVEPLGQAIARLREQWKKLDATGPAPRAQWERFDAMMEKAYRPVAAHRAAQAEKAKAIRAAREAQLAEWEAWSAGLDGAAPDWRAIERRRAEMLGAWHAGPRPAPRDERALRKRFDPLVAQLDARLAQVRAAETDRRQGLIARAEALREEADLARAMNEAKLLQAKWRDEAGGVHLGRRRDEDLWTKFRAACDSVFARRDAQKAERAAEKAGRDAARTLEAERAQEARRAAARAATQKDAQRMARFDVLARKAALAARVEEAAAAGGDAAQALVQAQAEWSALPALAADAERALRKRLEAAPGATREALARGLAERAGLLIDLELALELPTPPAEAEARRARQLLRLKERFSGASASEGTEPRVIRWHTIAAAADAGQDARIAAVVRALLEQEGRAARVRR